MKVLVYRVNTKRKEKKKLNIHMEKILFFSFLISFTLLVIVQTALMSPSVRTFIITNNSYEGTVLGQEEFLYQKGDITLGLQNELSNENLKVLVNGEQIGSFVNKTLDFTVKDGDVIELDGNGLIEEASVTVFSKSENIISVDLNKTIKISSGVKPLTIIHIQTE